MDTLTHGLLGAAIGSTRLPRWCVAPDESPRASRAGILTGVLAAVLPDVDYLLPARDAVLHTLQAHRGLTHALIAVPVVALVAAVLAKLVFRETRLGPLYVRALVSVPLAHLLPDLWTGWGTRLLLPFSDQRFALDWTMVVDPFFTVPLALAALWTMLRPARGRRAFSLGVGVSVVYLVFRVATAQHLTDVVREANPSATSVHVFPAPLGVVRWRYVARFGLDYAAGSVALGSAPHEEARVSSLPTGPVPEAFAAVPTVREALAWARFPVVRLEPLQGGGQRIEVADLRYHLRGAPTLAFIMVLRGDGTVTEARLERGGNLRELFARWMQPGP